MMTKKLVACGKSGAVRAFRLGWPRDETSGRGSARRHRAARDCHVKSVEASFTTINPLCRSLRQNQSQHLGDGGLLVENGNHHRQARAPRPRSYADHHWGNNSLTGGVEAREKSNGSRQDQAGCISGGAFADQGDGRAATRAWRCTGGESLGFSLLSRLRVAMDKPA